MIEYPNLVPGGWPGRLIAAPAVQPRESPASWIQRVCAAHHYSMKRIEDAMGIHPRFHDWDFRVQQADIELLLLRANCSPAAFEMVRACYKHFLCYATKATIAEVKRGPPRYRWCSACLDGDEQPYLRWWWRLPVHDHCPRHKLPMVSQCGACQSGLTLSYALSVDAGRRVPVLDLSYCQECGLPRSFAGALESNATLVPDTGSATGRSTTSPEPQKKARWGKDKFLIDDFQLAIGPNGCGRPPVLSISGATFLPDPVFKVPFKRNKWSARIPRKRTDAREKMAYVLRFIRTEMRSERHANQEAAATGADTNENR